MDYSRDEPTVAELVVGYSRDEPTAAELAVGYSRDEPTVAELASGLFTGRAYSSRTGQWAIHGTSLL